MDASQLVTPGETRASVKSTHTFLKVNAGIIFVVLIGWGAWMAYANSKKKWPYEPYERKTGPPGSHPINQIKLPGTGASSSSTAGSGTSS